MRVSNGAAAYRVFYFTTREARNMGFGSYDESEQQNQNVDADDDSEGVSVHENEHEGTVSFETDASTDDLIDQLGEMKDEDDE
jgi:hypothetical protein